MSSESDCSNDPLKAEDGQQFWDAVAVGTAVERRGIIPKRNRSGIELKGPWVPAPAKTSSQTNIIFSRQKNRHGLPLSGSGAANSNEMNISEMPEPTPQSSVSSISDMGFVTKSRPSAAKKSSSHSLSRHKLQTKDSFVAVTACLTRKRNRIMKLWEENLSTNDSTLLVHLENANRYGQQAAAQLEQMKKICADFHKGLIKEESMESWRDIVMESLKKFENENKVIQAMISNNDDTEFVDPTPVEYSPAAGDRSENIDLSLLNKMYSEKFSLANDNNFPKPKLPEENKQFDEKISEQEQTIKFLHSELKRVESQCSFDYRLLKSNLNEKLDDYNGFPELLHITEMKLAQCMSRNAVLEKIVQDKENESAQAFIEVNTNKSKVGSLTEKLRFVECENAQLKGRIKELEEFTLCQKQGTSTENILKTIESKLESLKTDSTSSKIQDLEAKLRLAKKHIQNQKRAKEDVTNRLTRRIEELMEALDDSRQKNHSLRNQLRLIRSSYHKLFPTDDLFGLEDVNTGDDNIHITTDQS